MVDMTDPSIAAFYGIPEEPPKGPTDAQIASQGTSNPYFDPAFSSQMVAQFGSIPFEHPAATGSFMGTMADLIPRNFPTEQPQTGGQDLNKYVGNSEIHIAHSVDRSQAIASALICGAVALACFTSAAKADEGGVSFWIPGFFGSLAAAPLQPGWSLPTNYYHTTVSAGADVARAREITIGRIPINLNANLSATLDARADLGWALPIYTFATPVLGGQASVGVQGMYGRVSTSLAGSLAGTLTTPLGTILSLAPTASAMRSGASET